MRSLENTTRVPAPVDGGRDLWNWVLTGLGLRADEQDRFGSVEDAARGGLGLHAARVASPFITAAARTRPGTDLAVLLGAAGDAGLVTVRCMRKTLHVLPVDLAAVAHAATRRYRLQDVRARIRRAGVPHGLVEETAVAVTECLAGRGWVPHRRLEASVASRTAVTAVTTRLALKWLWEDGTVTYRNCAPSPHREMRTFALRRESHPGFDAEADESQARLKLVEEYFRAFGPATVRDAAWWGGLGQTVVARALADLDAVRLDLPWAASPSYMLRDRWEGYLRYSDTLRGGVHFLAHEDVALKAYFESRGRYLAGRPAATVFNSIGEARPTVVVDGRVVALWAWDAASGRVRYARLPGGPGIPSDRAATVRRQAAATQRRIRRG